jgi:hypothetical protein
VHAAFVAVVAYDDAATVKFTTAMELGVATAADLAAAATTMETVRRSDATGETDTRNSKDDSLHAYDLRHRACHARV